MTRLHNVCKEVILNRLWKPSRSWELVSFRLESLMGHLVRTRFSKLIFKLRMNWVLWTYMYVLLLLIYATCLCCLYNDFIGHWHYAYCKIVGCAYIFSVELLFKWLSFFNDFLDSTTDIIKLKVSTCNRASVLLIAICIFSVNSLVICEINVVTVRIWICLINLSALCSWSFVLAVSQCIL